MSQVGSRKFFILTANDQYESEKRFLLPNMISNGTEAFKNYDLSLFLNLYKSRISREVYK